MDTTVVSLVTAFGGAVLGGLVSFLLQKQRFKHALDGIREQNKTEYMAEITANHLLSHKGYTDRSFEAIEAALGGFEADELRKILVRAGAVRVKRTDAKERWCLLSREDERIEKLQNRKNGASS